MSYRLVLRPSSPTSILAHSQGEVADDRLFNFRYTTPQPHESGLFSQSIFGTMRSNQCACGKYKGAHYVGKRCEVCKVMISSSRARSQNTGHIDLGCHVINPLCFGQLGKLLGIDVQDIFHVNLPKIEVEDHQKGNLFLYDGRRVRVLLTPRVEEVDDEALEMKSGPEALFLNVVSQIDLARTAEINEAARTLLRTKVDPQDLFLRYVVVNPPDHRPVQVSPDYIQAHPYNALYERLIRRSQSYRAYVNNDAPNVMKEYMVCMIQKAVNSLMVTGGQDANIELNSILDSLKGKGGLLRGNLLGRRVDFSARSVITSPGDRLPGDTVGIPKLMALELFKPFVIHELLKEYCETQKEANRLIESKGLDSPIVFKCLELAIKDRVVLLNRAPSLHRYSVVALWPKLVDDLAIWLPQVLCSPFGADYDGDTMSVHLPLSAVAQREAKALMMPKSSILRSLDSDPMLAPSHEGIIGLYLMTEIKDFGRKFIECDREKVKMMIETRLADGSPVLKINEKIMFRYPDGSIKETCAGRLIIEEIVGHNELPKELVKGTIKKLVSRLYDDYPPELCVKKIDRLNEEGFKWSTLFGFSISIDDMVSPSSKDELVAKAREVERKNWDQYHKDFENATSQADRKSAKDRRHERNVRNWGTVMDQLLDDYLKEFGNDNPNVLMYRSGARLTKPQIAQMSVAKGLMNNAKNEIIEAPIIHTYKDGLTPQEYFATCSGARKAMADKKSLTPIGGYLARRMVTAARDLNIVIKDCGDTEGFMIPRNEAHGKFDMEGTLLDKDDGAYLISVRSPVSCKAYGGICATCHGIDPCTRDIVRVGYGAGVAAAHALSEPVTQLSMKSKHTAGAATIRESDKDIKAVNGGVVSILHDGTDGWITVVNVGTDAYLMETKYIHLFVKDGDMVDSGQRIATYLSGISNDDVSGALPKLEAAYEARVATPLKGGIQAFMATEDCVLNIKPVEEDHDDWDHLDCFFEVSINGKYHRNIKGVPIFFPNGSKVKAGDRITYGQIHIKEFFNRSLDLNLTFLKFVQQLREILNNENMYPSLVNIEMIFRAMTDIVERDNDHGLRIFGETGGLSVRGITEVGRMYPSWLRQICFGWLKSGLVRAIESCKPSYGTRAEGIITGKYLTDDEIANQDSAYGD